MIKNNQTKLNYSHVVLDAVVIIISYAIAFQAVIGSHIGIDGVQRALPASVYFRALYIIVPIYIVLYGVFDLYMPKRIQSKRKELANICKANITGLMIITFCLFAGRNMQTLGPYLRNFSTRMIVAFFGVNIVLESLFRNVLRIFLRDLRSRGFNQKHVLMVGYSGAATGFIERNEDNPEWGYHIMGLIDDEL